MKASLLPSLLAVLGLLLGSAAAAAKAKETKSPEYTKETLTSEGQARTYYLFVPKNLKPETPAPVVLLFHGSGRNGTSLMDKWTKLAEEEGIVLAAPDALYSEKWFIKDDKLELLRDLVDELGRKAPVNPRRVYLFGHSAGGCYALLLSLLESEYFAATAVHAGALDPVELPLTRLATRKIPIALYVGKQDELFPSSRVQPTRSALETAGLLTVFQEIPRHDHDYYGIAPKVNRMAWDFLKTQELPGAPKFEPRQFR